VGAVVTPFSQLLLLLVVAVADRVIAHLQPLIVMALMAVLVVEVKATEIPLHRGVVEILPTHRHRKVTTAATVLVLLVQITALAAVAVPVVQALMERLLLAVMAALLPLRQSLDQRCITLAAVAAVLMLAEPLD
jgi:hypothetical protein